MLKSILHKIIHVISALFYLFALVSILFIPLDLKNTHFSDLSHFYTIDMVNNWALIAMILLVSLGIYWIWRRFGCRSSTSTSPQGKSFPWKKISVVCLVFTLLFQVILYHFLYFTAGNDTLNLAIGGKCFATDQWNDFYNLTYYQKCPNNLWPYFLNILAYQLGNALHFDAYKLLVWVSILNADLTLILLIRVTREITKSDGLAFFAQILFTLLYCLSPWVLIPYTDQLSVIFPIATIWLYLKLRDREMNPFLKTFLIVLIPIVTYKIKAMNIFVLLAIAVYEVVGGRGVEPQNADQITVNVNSQISGQVVVNVTSQKISQPNDKHKKIKSIGLNLCAICAVFLLVNMINVGIESYTGYVADDDQKLGMSWYLALGSNPKSFGQWSIEDYTRVAAAELTSEERQATALAIAEARYKKMGFTGLLKHWANKSKLFFDDGTFLFGICSGFFDEINDNSSPISSLLKDLLIPGEEYGVTFDGVCYGKYYTFYAIFMQLVWLTVFLYFGILLLHRDYDNRLYLIIKVVWIGLFLFFMLFECSPRLILSYLPVFILSSALGAGISFLHKTAPSL